MEKGKGRGERGRGEVEAARPRRLSLTQPSSPSDFPVTLSPAVASAALPRSAPAGCHAGGCIPRRGVPRRAGRLSLDSSA